MPIEISATTSNHHFSKKKKKKVNTELTTIHGQKKNYNLQYIKKDFLSLKKVKLKKARSTAVTAPIPWQYESESINEYPRRIPNFPQEHKLRNLCD